MTDIQKSSVYFTFDTRNSDGTLDPEAMRQVDERCNTLTDAGYLLEAAGEDWMLWVHYDVNRKDDITRAAGFQTRYYMRDND